MALSKSILILGLFATSLVWEAAVSQPDGRTHLWVEGSKQDLSVLIQSADGRFAIINPSDSSDFLEKLGQKMPFYNREIALVVVTKAGPTSERVVTELSRRYRLREVLLNSTSVSTLKGIKVHQMTGEDSFSWGNLHWDIFFLPDEDGALRLSSQKSLVFVTRGTASYWSVLPDWKDPTYLIGPLNTRSWPGQPLVERFHPRSIITNQGSAPLKLNYPVDLVGEKEIVW